MELTPSSGRPEKDPEKRRSELVHIRVRPSHKGIVRQEAERRDASMTLVVVRIAFEEMNPSGRLIPEPSVWRWLLDRAVDYRDVANDPGVNYPEHELGLSELSDRAEDLQEQWQKRKTLWRNARDESRDEVIGIRLKPDRFRWLEKRAEENDTSPSGLLRARALEGIDKRDQMRKVAQLLHKGQNEVDDLREKARGDQLSEKEVRSEMEGLAVRLEKTVEKLRETAT